MLEEITRITSKREVRIMDAKYLQEIKEREQAVDEVVGDSIPELTLELKKDGYDILLVDFFIEAFENIPALVAEVERLNDMLHDSFQGHLLDELKQKEDEIATLKKSLADLQRQFDMYGGDEGVTNLLLQIVTLKRALELACDDIDFSCGGNSMEQYDIYIKQAQEKTYET